MSADLVRGSCWEGCNFTCMARMEGADAAAITQSSVSSIDGKVFDKNSSTDTETTLTVAVATSVFNTLQTDARWDVDATGYNFRFTVPGSSIPDGGKTYIVEYVFTMADGSIEAAVFEIVAKELRSN